MKTVLIAIMLLAVPAWADNQWTPVDTTGPVTVNAQCTTPTTGCAVGQAVTHKINGRNTVSAQVVTANFTGTLTAYVSMDNGNNWTATLLRNSVGLPGTASAASALSASTATILYTILIPYAAVTDVMLASTAAVTNTATVQLTSTNSVPNIGTWATVKGTQPNQSAGFGTQDLKDSGRTFVVLGADGVAPAIADTIITFSQNKAGTVTAAQTTYAITAGKTLRLQSLVCSFTAGATANIVRVRLRLNTGGACVAASGLLAPAMELAPAYGTAAASQGGSYAEMAFPDGLELSGTSWNICLSESAVAATGTLTCTLTGFEY